MTPTGDMLAGLDAPAVTSVAGPIRTCVGCRARDVQTRLIRFARRSDGHVVPAVVTRDVLGRSAYLCPRRPCFDQAIKRRAFARAFSTTRRPVSVVNIDAEPLWSAIAEQLRCEIGLLDRTALDRTRENPHAHLRRRGLQQLLFELSSLPQTPGRSAAKRGPMQSQEPVTSANDELLTRKGGASSHG